MPDESAFTICSAASPGDVADAAALFRRYAAALDVDLAYQDFETELASLPGKYAPPAGALLLARRRDGTAAGCAALRPLGEDGVCEMKRLFVSPEGRGLGLGRCLATEIIATAKSLGYREIRLDTLPSMTGAIALYERLGFNPARPYYEGAVEGTLFFTRLL